MKYIRHNYYDIIAFGDRMRHDTMASLLGGRENIISAGMIERGADGKYRCCGQSTTLGIRSKPEEDTELLNEQGIV